MKKLFITLLLIFSYSVLASNDNFLDPYWWENATLEKVKKEVANGANVNIQDNYGWTPLMRAVENRKTKIVEYLIKNGVDIGIKNNQGYTAYNYYLGDNNLVNDILLGKRQKNTNITLPNLNIADWSEWLLNSNDWWNTATIADVIDSINNGLKVHSDGDMTILNRALENSKNPEIIKLLISRGGDVNTKDKSYGNYPIHYAVNAQNDKFLEILIDKGANVNAQDRKGRAALMDAVWSKNKNKRIINALLDAGADVNLKNNKGWTAYTYAFNLVNSETEKKTSKWDTYENPVLAMRLKGESIDVHAKDSDGDTLLSRSVSGVAGHQKNLEFVKYLIANGADINSKNNHGATPLHRAARYSREKRTKIVKYLIVNGANVNSKDNSGDTPLHNAENPQVIKALIIAGANINAKDKYDRTPLHSTLSFEADTTPEAVETLIQFGANVNAKDKYGETPLDNAKENKYLKNKTEIIAVLENSGGIEKIKTTQSDSNWGNAVGTLLGAYVGYQADKQHLKNLQQQEHAEQARIAREQQAQRAAAIHRQEAQLLARKQQEIDLSPVPVGEATCAGAKFGKGRVVSNLNNKLVTSYDVISYNNCHHRVVIYICPKCINSTSYTFGGRGYGKYQLLEANLSAGQTRTSPAHVIVDGHKKVNVPYFACRNDGHQKSDGSVDQYGANKQIGCFYKRGRPTHNIRVVN